MAALLVGGGRWLRERVYTDQPRLAERTATEQTPRGAGYRLVGKG